MASVVVTLVEGASFTTPRGRRWLLHQPVTLPDDHEDLRYYRSNSRFSVRTLADRADGAAGEPRSKSRREVRSERQAAAPPEEFFESPKLGRLRDTEENRLAARAMDEQGWSMGDLTGATLDEPGPGGLTLRQAAETPFDPAVHRVPDGEEGEHPDGSPPVGSRAGSKPTGDPEKLLRLAKVDVSDPDIRKPVLLKLARDLGVDVDGLPKKEKTSSDELRGLIVKRQTQVIADSQRG